MPPARRIDRIAAANTTFLAFIATWDRLRHDPDIADFAFGNPQEMVIDGFPQALVAASRPLDKDHYAYKRSEDAARSTVAKVLVDWHGLPFEPEDVAMTPGAFGAIATALDTLIDPGDEVIFSIPPWFFYETMILDVGAVPVKVPVRPEDHDLDVAAIAGAITDRTKMLIVNSPNNPTGRIYPPETLRRLSDVLSEASERRRMPIYLLSDEPYARLVFSDAEFTSPAVYYPNTLISYSYGKVLLTPGQRIGWLALSPRMPERESLRQAVFLGQLASGWLFPNALMQYAVDDLERMSIDLAALEAKRDRLAAELSAFGYELRLPEGTFYLWVRSPDPDDVAFVERLAERGVLVLPGTTCEAPGHFRISLTASGDMIDRALPVFASMAP
jgi:aspartate aminotransferase